MERHKGGHFDGCTVFPVGYNGLLLLVPIFRPRSPGSLVFRPKQLLLPCTLLEHTGIHPGNKVSRRSLCPSGPYYCCFGYRLHHCQTEAKYARQSAPCYHVQYLQHTAYCGLHPVWHMPLVMG